MPVTFSPQVFSVVSAGQQGPAGPAFLTVTEADGSPSLSGITTVQFPNGSVSSISSGVARVTLAGAGTVTTVSATQPAAGFTVSVANPTSTPALTFALSDDLAALEALSGTNTIYYRSGASTWSPVTIGSNLTFSGGTLSATGGGGGSGTVTSVTLTQPAAGLTITGSGTAITTTGTPTFALANDLAAVEGLSSTGLVRRTATDTWTAGTAVSLTAEVSGKLPTANGGLGADNSAATGVPVFAAGTATVTAATGTGAPVLNDSPTFAGTVTVPVLAAVNGGGYGFSVQPGNATSYWYVTNTGAGGTLAWATSAKGTLQVRSSGFGSAPQATCEWEVVGTAEAGFRINAPASYTGDGYVLYVNGARVYGVAGSGAVTAASYNGVTVTNGGSGALTVTGTTGVSGTNTGDQFTSVTASRLLGRGSAGGAGAAQEITLGSGFTMTGTTISVSAGGGNVSTSGSPVTGDYARWASASTIESRTASQVRGDIGLGSGDDVTFQSVTAAGYNGDGSALTDLNASQLTSGSVAYARGGLGGDISLSVGVPVFNAGSVAFVGTDGTGSFARVSSPTFTTPNIGAATATSVNGVSLTNGGSGALTVTGTTSVSGSNTGDQTSVTGNAGTATALQTARNINGVSFNGTADITVAAAAGTLTGTTMAANVVTSSLTTVGTIGAGVWQGTAVGVAYGGSGATTAVGARAAFGLVTLTTTATSGTVTIDCSAADITYVLSLTNNVTLALSNEADGRRFTLFVRGQASGYTITWWASIKWSGGAAPTIPTVSGRVLPISFIRLASGEWLGIPGTECY